MQKPLTLLGIVLGCALATCNPSEGEKDAATTNPRVNANLECAAMISAANKLVGEGKRGNNPALAKRTLVTSMAYLNAYAIPNGLREAEAFDDVKSHRAILIETHSPAEMISRAERCMSRSPL